MKQRGSVTERLGRAWLSILAGVMLALPATVTAQQQSPGRIVGLIQGEQGQPLAGAAIEVVGTDFRTNSGADGRYTITGVPPGQYDLMIRAIGFGPQTITGVIVASGEVTGQNATLAAEAIVLDEITVVAAEASGSVAAALDEQRYAANVVSTISEEEIARSPDSDAAEAMQRVSGVTVQDDQFVFVRGLGQRYTTTNLNGSRVPSLDPEQKVVPLDIFPANMLQGVTTSKTFTPEQAGDFAGAQVNLRTREFPLGRKVTVSSSIGANNRVTGQDLTRAPLDGQEWAGFAGTSRALDPNLAAAGSLLGSTQADINNFIAGFRPAWWGRNTTGIGNADVGVSIGGEDPVFGQLIGYVISGTYKVKQGTKAEEFRSLATASGPINEYSGESQNNSVLWGGIANLSTRIGSNTKLSFNNTYNRTGDNTATLLTGVNEEFSGEGELFLTRLSFVERSVWSSQLEGEHLIGGRHLFDWRAGLSGTRRYQPDMSDVIYTTTRDPGSGALVPSAWADIKQSATRTWSDLKENAFDGGANMRFTFGDPVQPTSIKVGGSYRDTDRDAPAAAYDIRNLSLTAAERARSPEVVFGQDNAFNSRLTLQANALAGSYTAAEQIGSGYVQAEIPLTGRLQLIAGARVENWQLDVTSADVFGNQVTSSPSETDVLPAITFNYQLSDDQNLRLAASQTVSRPEYREIAPISSVEILGDREIIGNPNLNRGLVQNYDLRWEFYPRAGETISAALFAKRFEDPIEAVLIAGTGKSAKSWVNASSAFNYGVEIEFRKSLDFVSEGWRNLAVIANGTLMESDITLGADSLSALTNDNRSMVGQAPYVVNGGLLWNNNTGSWTANILYNVVGRRIIEAGQQPLPDTYEEARHILDFALRGPLTENTSFKIDVRNILDAPVRVTQGDVLRVRYKTGREFKFGFKWDL